MFQIFYMSYILNIGRMLDMEEASRENGYVGSITMVQVIWFVWLIDQGTFKP